MSKIRCGTCKYIFYDEIEVRCECRRYPPQIYYEADIANHGKEEAHRSEFPETYEDCWCGEYKKRDK